MRDGQLMRSNTRFVYPVTSVGLSRLLAPQVERVHFHGPRDALLIAIGSSRCLTDLSLGGTNMLTPVGWTALCGAAASLRSIRLSNLGGIDDAMMGQLLSGCRALEVLKVRSLILTRGYCFARLDASYLKRLSVSGCCTDEASMRDLLSRAPQLESLKLTASGESTALFRILALHCRKLHSLWLYTTKPVWTQSGI